MNPKVSIIIPCYNAEKYIEQCVRSAMTQTYENTEVIFVDNDSGDDSLEIVENLQDEFPNLQVDTAPNLYPFSWEEPVEKALSMASGEYFTILGSDDYISEDYVSKIMEKILNSKDPILVMQSKIKGVNENSELMNQDVSHTYSDLKDFKNMLLERCPVTTPSVVYKTDLHKRGIVRWLASEYLGAADYDLYFNLADNDVFIHPFEEWLGYYYRWHEDQATWGMQKQPLNYDFMLQNQWREKWGM